MITYERFLADKSQVAPDAGLVINPEDLSSALYPFQTHLTAWEHRKGRAAIFADCGLGKTLMQLEWARNVPGRTLIYAPGIGSEGYEALKNRRRFLGIELKPEYYRVAQKNLNRAIAKQNQQKMAL